MASETSANAETVHRCLRPGCGRKLTSSESIARGYGPRCAAKIRAAGKAADLSAWTPRQVEQARELIEDGGLVPAGRDSVFLAVSTDGTEVYRCAAEFCECPAGQKDTHCYHVCAVTVTLAASAPAAPVVQPLALAA
jgi:hypothetical protein